MESQPHSKRKFAPTTFERKAEVETRQAKG
jgi:hypothetical protein